MKRLIVVMCILSFLVALPLSHSAMAKEKPAKVPICHVNSANDILEIDYGMLGIDVFTFGKVIWVAESAVPAHEAHGDSVDYWDLDEATRDWAEVFYDISLPNANCYTYEWIPPQP